MAGSCMSSTVRLHLQETTAARKAAVGLCILSSWHDVSIVYEETMCVLMFSGEPAMSWQDPSISIVQGNDTCHCHACDLNAN